MYRITIERRDGTTVTKTESFSIAIDIASGATEINGCLGVVVTYNGWLIAKTIEGILTPTT